jgi:glycosyltransferase involved in cell wall biosynthesis
VAAQIRRAYGRESEVIHPPVDCELFRPAAAGGHDGYYLFSGRLVEPYKRPGIVIDAFRSLPHRLVVAGDGPAYPELRERAGPNVEFVGHVDDAELVSLMQRCAATVFPSVDDFGLVPVETMACGRPVLAFAGGGALETVVAGRTGEFFGDSTAAGLVQALRSFDPDSYDPAEIRAHAERWNVPRFQEAILSVLSRAASA